MMLARLGKLLLGAAIIAGACLAQSAAIAMTFSGDLPVGYSDNMFQIGPGTSFMAIDVSAFGSRDPTLCSFCSSSYTDNYTVNYFDRAGALLTSVNETNYLYYNMYSSSHGIGAGPVFIATPGGATTLEIVNQLSISGLLGADGLSLRFGNLNIGL